MLEMNVNIFPGIQPTEANDMPYTRDHFILNLWKSINNIFFSGGIEI